MILKDLELLYFDFGREWFLGAMKAKGCSLGFKSVPVQQEQSKSGSGKARQYKIKMIT